MKAEQELLLNLHPSSTPPHPGLTLRPTGKRPSCVRKVDIFSQHPGPEMGTPRLLTSPSSPPTQDTADYVKPVAFSVEYSLEDPDHGPMLDDGWPTTLRVSVHPCTWGTQPWPSATPPPPDLLPKAQIPSALIQSSSPLAPSCLLPCKPATGLHPSSLVTRAGRVVGEGQASPGGGSPVSAAQGEL